MSKNLRVFEIARENKLDVEFVISEMKKFGIVANNKFSTVSLEQANRFKEELERQKRKKIRETRKGGGALVRRRVVSKSGLGVMTRKKPEAPKVEIKPVEAIPTVVEPKVEIPAVKPQAVKVPEVKIVETTLVKEKVSELQAVKTVKIAEAPKVAKVEKVAKVVKPVAVKSEAVKSEAVKPEAKPKLVKSEAVKPKSVKPEVAKEKSVSSSKTKKGSKKVAAQLKTGVVTEAGVVKVVEFVAKAAAQKAADAEALKIEENPQSVVEVDKTADETTAKEGDKKDKGNHKREVKSLPGKPEASASPYAGKKGVGPALKSGKRVEYSSKQLGPTGRFILLQKSPAEKAKAAAAANDKGKTDEKKKFSTPGKPKAGAFRSYRERRREQELLRKTGPTKKKAKTERPAIPPEGMRKIRVDEFISVSELAKQMSVKAIEVIKKLITLGQMVNINSTLDIETADIVGSEWGYEIENIGFKEDEMLGDDEPVDESKLKPRSPVVTIMGHVDHGKTSLLDVIRKSDIVSNESGGITQHIGAYKVKTKDGTIVFIDTPGHEAFSSMRARGVRVTDIVILVVAADDGVMPQTIEAINHCKESKVPMIVAITKVDKSNANPEMVKQKLAIHELIDESWGGDTIMVEVSSINKTGVDTLLEMVLLQSEILDLKADPDSPAKAFVLEGELHKAKGPLVNILVKNGNLSVGDFVISGSKGGKIRSIVNDRGQSVKNVGPASPVEVSGLDGVPAPGDDFRVVTDEKTARRILDRRRDDAKVKDLARKSQAKGMDAIRLAIAKGQYEQLNIILKSDVQGTMEAIKDALLRLSTEKVKVNVVHAGVGGVNETDINLATTANAVVMGFRVRPASKARHKAEKSGISVNQYNVIYDLIDDVKALMRGLLPKEKKEKLLGKIEVREVFTIPKVGTIAGSYVLEGKVNRNCQLRLFRDNIQIHEGKVSSLRRFKDDAKEVLQGYECGIGFENYHDIKTADVLEVYEIIEVQAEL
jgi:translation initiation factor IF-2